MIVATRYRDISWREAQKCQPTGAREFDESLWNSLRGRAISIITPSTDSIDRKHVICEGPFYWRADRRVVVCPHIAEIGD